MAGPGWYLRIQGPWLATSPRSRKNINLHDTRSNLSRQDSMILGENNQIVVGMSPDFTIS